jgi:chromosome partitioning protein
VTVTATIYAFANQKGGVGKTTSCVNLAASLHSYGQRILLLDLDPQGNATMGSGVDKTSLSASINELLLGSVDIEEAIHRQTPAGYDLVGANSDLTEAEALLIKRVNQEYQLKNVLNTIRDRYDYILMDCPPSLNMLTINALVAADAVIIAMQCEYYAMEGLSDLINTITQLRASRNPNLEIGGIIRTLFDPRNRLCIEVSRQLITHFQSKVFQTVIPRNVRLAEAPSYGLPAHMYDKNSRGAVAYMVLASEFLKRAQQYKETLAQRKQPAMTQAV